MKKLHPLRVYRQDVAGMSLAELAAQCGTTDSTLSRIERGEQWPSHELLQAIIDATGGQVSANDFLAYRNAAA